MTSGVPSTLGGVLPAPTWDVREGVKQDLTEVGWDIHFILRVILSLHVYACPCVSDPLLHSVCRRPSLCQVLCQRQCNINFLLFHPILVESCLATLHSPCSLPMLLGKVFKTSDSQAGNHETALKFYANWPSHIGDHWLPQNDFQQDWHLIKPTLARLAWLDNCSQMWTVDRLTYIE